jgi:hypothetical protein
LEIFLYLIYAYSKAYYENKLGAQKILAIEWHSEWHNENNNDSGISSFQSPTIEAGETSTSALDTEEVFQSKMTKSFSSISIYSDDESCSSSPKGTLKRELSSYYDLAVEKKGKNLNLDESSLSPATTPKPVDKSLDNADHQKRKLPDSFDEKLSQDKLEAPLIPPNSQEEDTELLDFLKNSNF